MMARELDLLVKVRQGQGALLAVIYFYFLGWSVIVWDFFGLCVSGCYWLGLGLFGIVSVGGGVAEVQALKWAHMWPHCPVRVEFVLSAGDGDTLCIAGAVEGRCACRNAPPT